MPADQAGVTWSPTNNFYAGRDGQAPHWLILHGTASGADVSAEAIASYYRSTEGSNNPVSSHYVIGRDGSMVQCVAEADGAWANGVLSEGHDAWWGAGGINPNNVTISIEHVKATLDNSDGLTDAQRTASFALIADICQRHGIPMRKADAQGGITGHYSVDPANRSQCPGNYPWADLFAYLVQPQGQGNAQPTTPTPSTTQEETMLTYADVANYFVELSPTRWRSRKTGFDVAEGILAFYQQCPFLGLPLGPETYPLPETAVQEFERGTINYDPKRRLDSPLAAKGDAYLAKIEGPDKEPVTVPDPVGEKCKAIVRELLAVSEPLKSQL